MRVRTLRMAAVTDAIRSRSFEFPIRFDSYGSDDHAV